jgi:hypothetical protein
VSLPRERREFSLDPVGFHRELVRYLFASDGAGAFDVLVQTLSLLRVELQALLCLHSTIH